MGEMKDDPAMKCYQCYLALLMSNWYFPLNALESIFKLESPLTLSDANLNYIFALNQWVFDEYKDEVRRGKMQKGGKSLLDYYVGELLNTSTGKEDMAHST
jgi:hypothetical protein